MKYVSILFISLFVRQVSFGQEITNLVNNDNGSYSMDIDGNHYLAIDRKSQETIAIMKVKLDSIKRVLELKEGEIETYQKVERALSDNIEKRKEYISALEALNAGYKDLSSGYRQLAKSSSGSLFSFSAGLGASGDNAKPLILGGVGVGKFRAWGMFQENNAGVILGVELPIFGN